MMCLIQKAEYEIFLIMETIQFMYEKMNKLVRDNIPNIIEQQGDKPDFVILDSFDYYNELKKKLTEFEEMRSKKNKSNGKFKNKIFLNGVHRMS